MNSATFAQKFHKFLLLSKEGTHFAVVTNSSAQNDNFNVVFFEKVLDDFLQEYPLHKLSTLDQKYGVFSYF